MMYPPTHKPTETTYERQDLLRQEAHNSRAGRVAHRVARWIRTIARVAFVLLVVGILAATVVGPGRVIDWIGTYLFPVVVMVGVVIAALALLVQAVKRLPVSPLRDWYQ